MFMGLVQAPVRGYQAGPLSPCFDKYRGGTASVSHTPFSER